VESQIFETQYLPLRLWNKMADRFTVTPASDATEAQPIGDSGRTDTYGAATIQFTDNDTKGNGLDPYDKVSRSSFVLKCFLHTHSCTIILEKHQIFF